MKTTKQMKKAAQSLSLPSEQLIPFIVTQINEQKKSMRTMTKELGVSYSTMTYWLFLHGWRYQFLVIPPGHALIITADQEVNPTQYGFMIQGNPMPTKPQKQHRDWKRIEEQFSSEGPDNNSNIIALIVNLANNQQLSLTDIAKKFHTSKATLHYWVRRLGIKTVRCLLQTTDTKALQPLSSIAQEQIV